MKKQFFYAALAIGMMSSCSSNDLPGNQQPENPNIAEDKVAIELGIASPNLNIEATTKGIGAVGGTAAEGNEWNKEKLGVWMYKVTYDESGNARESEALNDDNTTYVLEGYTFEAPADGSTDAKQQIRIVKDENASPTLYQAVYYPSKYAHSFYGYHLDDARVEPSNINRETQSITDITIDGTQDIMTAGTKEVNLSIYGPINGIGDGSGETPWETAAKQSFSAWSARRGIQPILNFEHKLARLRFFVKAGEKSAASKVWNSSGNTWDEVIKVPVTSGESENQSQAVQITSVKLLGVADKINLELKKDGVTGKMKPAIQSGSTTDDFTLQERTSLGTALRGLTPIAPEYFDGEDVASKAEATGYEEKTRVGESIMFLPVTADGGNGTDAVLNLEIEVQQAVLDTYEEPSPEDFQNKTYILKKGKLTTQLLASSITGTSPQTSFVAGYNYDVTIKVYSFQRIEITAELTPWGNGGSIEVAPGDEF